MDVMRSKMNKALKDLVIPELRKTGFSGAFPHFRRIKSAQIDLLTFQFDKYGGGFIIELAFAKNESFKTHWGKEIPSNKLTAHDLNNRVRIHPVGFLENSSTDDWFRYDKSKSQHIFQEISEQVLNSLNVIETYFAENTI